MFTLRGKAQEPTSQLVAGDIGALAKLAETATGDTLAAKERPLVLSPISFPAPAFSAAVHPKTKADLDKMGSSLTRIVEEDPTLRVHRDDDTGETILSGLGEPHLEVTVEKIQRKFGVGLELTMPKVPYKETITAPKPAPSTRTRSRPAATASTREYLSGWSLCRGAAASSSRMRSSAALCPRPTSRRSRRAWCEALREGVLARYPLVDVKVTLYDGKEHPVDSSEMAFKIAGGDGPQAGRLPRRSRSSMEPIMTLRVIVPEANTGDAMGDLNSKRAKVWE